MQPPDRVLSAFLFWFYQLATVTDTYRNVEVSRKESREVFCIKFPTDCAENSEMWQSLKAINQLATV